MTPGAERPVYAAALCYWAESGEEKTYSSKNFSAANNSAAAEKAKDWARSFLTGEKTIQLQVNRDGRRIANISKEGI